MIIWGLRPGPLLFVNNPDFVWGLIGSPVHGQLLFTVIINIAFIPLFVSVLKAVVHHPGADYFCFVHRGRICADPGSSRRLADRHLSGSCSTSCAS